MSAECTTHHPQSEWRFGGETGDTNAQVDEEERAEVGFFAMAFYTQDEAARIDRRVRSRTTALWNAIRPTDTLSPGDAPCWITGEGEALREFSMRGSAPRLFKHLVE